MKKVFLAIAVVAVFTACNNGGEAEAAKDTTVVKIDSPVVVPTTPDTTVIKVDSPAVAPKADTTKKM